MSPMQKKTCNKCETEKLLGFFRANRRNKDGHDKTCSQCRTRYESRKKVLKKRGGAQPNPFHDEP